MAEKKCPEGQEWCENSQKCVTPPGRGLKRGKQDGKQGKLIEKYLGNINEGKGDIENFVDNVVRLLMGERVIALGNLKQITLDMDFSSLDPKKYNTLYNKLYKSLLKVIQKELRSELF